MGKLRLMFEAQAFAFLAHHAGGACSDGVGPILDLQPHHLHQRVPVYVGNRDLVAQADAFITRYDSDWQTAYRRYRDQQPAL
jgi:fructose-1,6-bisphosphatase I